MSKVSIVNKALSYLGANRITSLSDETLEAQSASNLYTDSLKSILAECDWRFATKRVMLARVDKKPAWGGGNYFQLPSDLVEIFEVLDKNIKWQKEDDFILAHTDTFGIKYVYFCDDSSKYPSYFIDAFALKLAADMCYEITNSNEKTMSLLELYKGEYLPVAKTKNSRQASLPVARDDFWVSSVLGGIYG